MDLTALLDAHCSLDELRPWVDSLDRYPQWLSIVPSALFEEGSTPPAWSVELRAKVGPIARSKRLRMVRTVDDQDHVRFERAEVDGRSHSPWILDVSLRPIEAGTRLVMALHYGGSFGAGLFERLLEDEIESSKQTLRALVE
jgi:hypothetical protein